ncbi:MAG: hypothetical protein LKE40_05130 [Spirochaetia bacterium]|nr:hypothetical protein [Spirochaetia bacterium]
MFSLVFLIYFVIKGWPLLIIGAVASMIVCIFNGISVTDGYLTTYMNGVGGFLIGQLPIFLWGAVFGEIYGTSGAASSIARGVSNIFRGKHDKLTPLATILIVFISGLLLSYGGVSAIVLMFVMTPLTLELCRESDIPRYMVPGMILGCIATSALAMPGSPQIQNVQAMWYLGTSSMAAALPGFIAGTLILFLNVMYLNTAAKKEIAGGHTFETTVGAEAASTDKELPNPLIALIPMVVVFVLFNAFKINVNFALMVGSILAIAIFAKQLKGLKDILKALENACTNACVVSCQAGAVAGFGSVVAITNSFAIFSKKLTLINGPALLIAMFALMVMTLICGSGPAGLGAGLPMFTPTFQSLGVNMNAFHRIASFSATTFDTLPTNAGYIAANEIAKTNARQSYKYVGICTVLNTTIGTLVLTLLCIKFPGLC